MMLPKAKEKKLIKASEFIQLAKKVKKSLEEEMGYMQEKN